MKDFSIVHNMKPNIEKVEEFPSWSISEAEIIHMSRYIKMNKAVGNDGIYPYIFHIARHKPCKTDWSQMCESCIRKIKVVKLLMTK